MKEYKHFTVEQREGITILTFVDSHIDGEVMIFEARAELLSFVNELHRDGILINCGNVTFMSAAFQSTIISFMFKMRDAGMPWVMTNMPPYIYEVFELTKVSSLFQVESTIEEGLVYLHSARSKERPRCSGSV